MGHFMREHAAQFARREQTHDAFCYGHRAVLRIAACSEGIGSFLRHQINTGLGNARVVGQFLHHAVEHGGLLHGKFPRAVHGKHDFVGIPVTADIHHQGEGKGDHDTASAAHSASEHNDQTRKQSQQKHGFNLAGHA